ncbi:MAG: hypothetical protein GX844_06605 [Alcaligenaceae bacterium]|nr:hypothetical protein [Alcaligenaceae bacterium]
MSPNRSNYKNDIRLIDGTLLNLVKSRLFILIALTALVLGILYVVANKILDFGKSIDYSFLDDIAATAVIEYLDKYNIYFWWALVVIIALFTLLFLNSMVRQSFRSFAETNVPMPVVRNLMSRLSPASLEVLSWVWNDRREPIKITDLKQLSQELRQGRFNRINDAREQEELLNQGINGAETREIITNNATTTRTSNVEPQVIIAQAEPELKA